MPAKCALLLAPESPYPLAGGGALRTASMLEYLARRYAVDVIVFREPGAADPGATLPARLVRELTVIDLPPNGRSFAAKASRNAGRILRRIPPLVDRFSGFGARVGDAVRGKRYDVSVIEHFWCAAYWDQIAPVAARTVLDLHNIESVLHDRCGRVDRAPESLAHRVFQRACVNLERMWLPRYSRVLTTSAEDARTVQAISPESRVSVYRNALPHVPAPDAPEEDAIVFSGNLEYHPNVGAVRYFAREIWPRLRQAHSKLRWRLIGKSPHAVARYVEGDKRIECTGPVDDAIAELARAKVAVAPLLAGSGTRFKIMEAFAAARAVVSTTVGAEGLPVRVGEEILIADDSSAFLRAVDGLLRSPDWRCRLGRAGRSLYEKEFTWEAAWPELDRLWETLT